MDTLSLHIESLIFCSEYPVKIKDIALCLNDLFQLNYSEEDIKKNIEELIFKYTSDEYSFGIYNIANGYQFLTKPAYQTSLSIFLKQSSKKRLTTSSLETMAIISYKQPITKGQIEEIRGVNCDYAVHKLLEKELIEIKGKAETVGKPILYGTTNKFLDYFGISSLNDLPLPKDFSNLENEIGQTQD